MTSNHLYHRRLKELWEKAGRQYASGNRDPDRYFDREDLEWMRSVGVTVMDLYDFAEDFHQGGEPDWETFLLIQSVRRDYFLEVQNGAWSSVVLDEADLPAREEAIGGMEWLPRLIVKARAKLRGELCPTIMYCCGGDRKFFRNHDIHPADFLRAAWAFEDDRDGLVEWTAKRGHQAGTESQRTG